MMAKRRYDQFIQIVEPEIVIVYVGPEEKEFKVLRKQICDAADYFKAMFGGSFKEASNKMARFPEDNVDAWGLFVQWLDQSIQPFITSSQHNDSDLEALEKRVRLYCLAEAYGIDRLMDYAIDTIRQGYKIDTQKPTLSIIEYAYAKTHEESPLRSLMCSWFYLLTTKNNFNPDELCRLSTEHRDLLRDYFKLLQSDKSMPQSIEDQDVSNLCIHHQHTRKGDKTCSNQKRSPVSLSENAEKVLLLIRPSPVYHSACLERMAKTVNLNEHELMPYIMEIKSAKRAEVEVSIKIRSTERKPNTSDTFL